MGRLRRTHLMATVMFVGGVLSLGGCMNSEQQDNAGLTVQHGEQLVASMPGLVRAFGAESVSTLSEISCTSSPDPAIASRNTRWQGTTGASVASPEEGRERAAAVREHAESAGWVSQEGGAAHPNLERLYSATMDDLTLVIDMNSRGEQPEVSLSVSSPCLEKPEGHTMTRSEFDPMYGSSDPLYPNDDASQFTNGEPRPLPGAADD